MKEKMNHRDIVAVIIFLITIIVIIWYTIINQNIDSDGKMNQTNIKEYENYGKC